MPHLLYYFWIVYKKSLHKYSTSHASNTFYNATISSELNRLFLQLFVKIVLSKENILLWNEISFSIYSTLSYCTFLNKKFNNHASVWQKRLRFTFLRFIYSEWAFPERKCAVGKVRRKTGIRRAIIWENVDIAGIHGMLRNRKGRKYWVG